MQANAATIDVHVPHALFQTGPWEWSYLQAGAQQPAYVSHVWQVWPVRRPGLRPCGRPSPVGEFRVLPQPGFDTSGYAIPLRLLIWKVPYEEVLSGRPIQLAKLPKPSQELDTLAFGVVLTFPDMLALEKGAILLGRKKDPKIRSSFPVGMPGDTSCTNLLGTLSKCPTSGEDTLSTEFLQCLRGGGKTEFSSPTVRECNSVRVNSR